MSGSRHRNNLVAVHVVVLAIFAPLALLSVWVWGDRVFGGRTVTFARLVDALPLSLALAAYALGWLATLALWRRWRSARRWYAAAFVTFLLGGIPMIVLLTGGWSALTVLGLGVVALMVLTWRTWPDGLRQE